MEDKDIERCNQLIKIEHANWIGINNQLAIKHLLEKLEKKDTLINTMQAEFERLEDLEDNTDILKSELDRLQKENEELKEYIFIAPNLDEMTATKYKSIQEEAYIRGRAEEQQKAEQIIYENYIPKSVIQDEIEELESKLNVNNNIRLYTLKDSYELQMTVLKELLNKGE